MAEKIDISERISYIKATENPLSADIGMVLGDEYLWLFDIGADKAALEEVLKIQKPKKLVISHFHPDHTGNFEHAVFEETFVGANTFKYTYAGTIVEKDVFIDDGIKIHIFPLPSSHAKGSVGMEAGEYAFLGDATYATAKQGRVCYNASVLKEEIAVLKKLSAKYFLISHDEKYVQKKEKIIAELEEIYSKCDPKESYIWL
ncbi:MAG: MBL fold metallo-hydrolase [Oscillospiraceae bacterium]|nr:MBL fold metallo-hydrolase [Oscillospiraceae bacterium]